MTNGCVAASLPAGKYYVGIGGANNMDSNRYDLRIRRLHGGKPDRGGQRQRRRSRDQGTFRLHRIPPKNGLLAA